MAEWLDNLNSSVSSMFSTPQRAPGYSAESAMRILKEAGYDETSPEAKALTFLFKGAELAKPRDVYADKGVGAALFSGLAAGGLAAANRRGGADHNSAVAQAVAPVQGWYANQQNRSDKDNALSLGVTEAAFPLLMDSAKKEREDAKRMKIAQLMYGDDQSPVVGGVEKGTAPHGKGVAGAEPIAPSSGDGNPAPGIVTAGGGTPGAPSTPMLKFDQGAMPYSLQDLQAARKRMLISSAMGLKDEAANHEKDFDNMVAANKLFAEQIAQRQAQNPDLQAKIKEAEAYGQGLGKANAQIKTDARNAALQIPGITSNLQAIVDIANDPNFATTAVGAYDNAKVPLIGGTWGDLHGILNYQGHVDTRDKIMNSVGAIASIMKPFVRGTGEGAWTDKDQEYLDRLASGNILNADDAEGLKTRVGELVSKINGTFLSKYGLTLDQVIDKKTGKNLGPAASQASAGGQTQGGGTQAAPAAAVRADELKAAPEGHTLKLPDGTTLRKAADGQFYPEGAGPIATQKQGQVAPDAAQAPQGQTPAPTRTPVQKVEPAAEPRGTAYAQSVQQKRADAQSRYQQQQQDEAARSKEAATQKQQQQQVTRQQWQQDKATMPPRDLIRKYEAQRWQLTPDVIADLNTMYDHLR